MSLEQIENRAEKRARMSWGDDIPDWVLGLARECDRSSQNKVAKRMGYSAAALSSIIGNRYKADLEKIESVYRGVFENAHVSCPELGEVRLDVCRDWQKKARNFYAANSQRVRMFHACKGCPLFRTASEQKGGEDEAS